VTSPSAPPPHFHGVRNWLRGAVAGIPNQQRRKSLRRLLLLHYPPVEEGSGSSSRYFIVGLPLFRPFDALPNRLHPRMRLAEVIGSQIPF